MRYWKRLNPDKTISTVESYSHNLDIDGAVEIDEAEFDNFVASLPLPPKPTDWQVEWNKATITTDKIKVLAKMMGLEVT